MNTYSIRFYRNGKWDKRGVRVTCFTLKEAVIIAKVRKKIPTEEEVLIDWYYVILNNNYDF